MKGVFILAIVMFFCSCFNMIANKADNGADSIAKLNIHDTIKVQKLIEEFDIIIVKDAEVAKLYAKKIYEISKPKNYKFGEGMAFCNMATACFYLDEYDVAIKNLIRSEEILASINNSNGLGLVYNAYGEIFTLQGEYSNSIKCLFKSLKFFEKAKNKLGIAKANNNIGVIFKQQGDYEIALQYFTKAFEQGNNTTKGDASLNLGATFILKKNYIYAKKYLEIATSYGNKNNDLYVLSTALDHLGTIEMEHGNYEKAIEFFRTSINMKIEIEDSQGKAISLNNLGKIYLSTGKFDKAIENFEEAKNIAIEIGVKKELADAYDGLAKSFSKKNDFSKAYDYLLKAFVFLTKFNEINKDISDEETSKKLAQKQAEINDEKKNNEILLLKKDKEIEAYTKKILIYGAIALLVIAIVIILLIYLRYKIKKKSNIQLLQQNQIILQQKEEIMAQSEQLELTNKELEKLSIVASQTDNAVIIANGEGKIEWVNQAFTRLFGYTLSEFIAEKGDNLFDVSSNKQFADLINKAKQSKTTISYNSQINTKDDRRLWLQTTLTPIVDSFGDIYQYVAIDSDISEIKEAEEEIRSQKQEITDSIHYAKRIQNANLPDESLIGDTFSDYFILYMPKDIVSGDFYWYTEIEGQIIITVADCTGHGVPGAFMTMLGISFLREIVQKEYITQPAVILRKLRKEIVKSLHQKGISGEQKDGMDMALVSINKETKLLQYAGAHNPLVIVRKQRPVSQASEQKTEDAFYGLEEIKADKMPVAIYDRMDQYTNHEIQLEAGDTFYMFSDGYADQFGGPKLKKFLSKNFKSMLANMRDNSMPEQKTILENEISQWKNDAEQTDDITVVGIRI